MRGLWESSSLEQLDLESFLESIFQTYSKGRAIDRIGKFTILSFSREASGIASIGYKYETFFSGGGAQLEYEVRDNDSVRFRRALEVQNLLDLRFKRPSI